jgi:hypothetical protein
MLPVASSKTLTWAIGVLELLLISSLPLKSQSLPTILKVEPLLQLPLETPTTRLPAIRALRKLLVRLQVRLQPRLQLQQQVAYPSLLLRRGRPSRRMLLEGLHLLRDGWQWGLQLECWDCPVLSSCRRATIVPTTMYLMYVLS